VKTEGVKEGRNGDDVHELPCVNAVNVKETD